MDKGKNRSDLLAAGRKKLQQFRKKKDNKGGGKSSVKAGKTEADPGVDPDGPGADPMALLESDRKEGGVSSSEQCNGDGSEGSELLLMIEDRKDGADEMREEEVDGNHEGALDAVDYGGGREVGVPMLENEKAGMNLTSEDHSEKIGSASQEVTQSSALNSTFQGEDVNASDEQLRLYSYEQNPEGATSSQDMIVADGGDGVQTDGELKGEVNDEVAVAVDREPLRGVLEGNETSVEEKIERAEEEHGEEPTSLQDVLSAQSKDGVVVEADLEKDVDLGSMGQAFIVKDFTIQNKIEGVVGEFDGANVDVLEEPSTSEEITSDKSKNGVAADASLKGEGHVKDRKQQPYAVEDDASRGGPTADLLEDRTMSIEAKGDSSRDSFFPAKLEVSSLTVDDSLAAGLELLKSHLYQACIVKDFLNLQLDEQMEGKTEFDQHSSEQISKLWDLLNETEKSKVMVTEELANCQSEFQLLVIKNVEVESQVLSLLKEVENIKAHLYMTYVANDLIQLQLDDQTQAGVEFHQHSLEEMSRSLLKETQDSVAMVGEELVNCKGELQALTKRNEELENQCFSAKKEVEELNSLVSELQSKLEVSQVERAHVSDELAECRGSLDSLKKENLNLAADHNLELGIRKKLEEENEFVSRENLKLASELSEYKERLAVALDQEMLHKGNLRAMGLSFEQLIDENLYLSSSSDVYNAMLKDLIGKCYDLPLQSQQTGNHASSSHGKGSTPDITIEDQKTGDSTLFQKVDVNDSSTYVTLGVLKGHIEEAEIALRDLEKSTQAMHSHSMSASKSGGRAVSKLIQAFESKTHNDDSVSDEVPLAVEERTGSLYEITKEQTCNLRAVLKKLELDLGKAGEELCKKFEVENETQRQWSDNLQAQVNEFVEREVKYKSLMDDLQNQLNEVEQSANSESERLLSLVETLRKEGNDRASLIKQEWNSIEAVILGAMRKLNTCTGEPHIVNSDVGSYVSASINVAVEVIENLHMKIEGAYLDYNKASTSYEELNRLFMDMQERNKLAADALHGIYSNLTELVDFSCKNIGPADLDINDENMLQILPEECEVLIRKLQKRMDDLLPVHSAYVVLESELLIKSEKIKEYEQQCSESAIKLEELHHAKDELEAELLHKNEEIEEHKHRCNELATDLEQLQHAKDGLELVLMNKSKELEELGRRCLSLTRRLEFNKWKKDSDALDELAGVDQVAVESNNIELSKSVLLRLEALVDSLAEKYDEAMEQITLSRNCLYEINTMADTSVGSWSLPLPNLLKQELIPKVLEFDLLQEKVHSFSASNHQLENELLILKEGYSKMQAALEDSCSKLQLKLSELEQSEQRLSSVREKLSVAVAKGKSLIVQRDSLKQSLLEKSSELEKCEQELLSKEILLREVQSKLKSCSEAERVEALESELSYIRNSATALRDSFLLKDSVLLRIEEILEDLNLSEHFHSKDIVEKVEMLAGFVSGNSSFPLNDCDQKSSVEGSQSGAGFMVMDATQDDFQQSRDSGHDDLRRKYEELQSKFYGVAEHNDMLEQSLLERNSLVHKWEGVLDAIDMPPQLRILEPEDKIEWLGRTLGEVQRERDMLQLKIGNLEASSGMLIADLEESHKKISELTAEIVSINSEKEVFSESLEKLRSECLNLSEKIVQDEVEKENLQKDVADLKGDLVERIADKDRQFEGEIHKLLELVCSVLPDADSHSALSGACNVENLEGLLRKLIDKIMSLSAEKTVPEFSERELVIDKSGMPLDIKTSEDVQGGKDQDLMAVRLELDEVKHDLNLVTEEKDATAEKCCSLMAELDTIRKQMDSLLTERTVEIERYQSLVLESEAVVKQRDALQEQLSLEEQKSTSAREKLNIAVRKGKGLVQQRDSLKQSIDEMNAMLEHLNTEHNQQIKALESEKSSLMSQLAVTEQNLQESRQVLSGLLNALHAINLGNEITILDPVQKMEQIGQFINNLKSSLLSSEHELKKSKQAAELLLAELNEVQERGDDLQEELVKAETTLLEYSKQREDAESARVDALSHLNQVTAIHSEERKKQTEHMWEIASAIDQLRKSLLAFSSLLADVFSKNMGIFCQVDTFVEFVLKQMIVENVAGLSTLSSDSLLSSNLISEEKTLDFSSISNLNVQGQLDDSSVTKLLAFAERDLRECLGQFDQLKENVRKHYISINQQASHLSKTMGIIQSELTSQKELSESLRRDISGLELILEEKETTIQSLSRNLTLLYDACSISISEIENTKAQKSGNSLHPMQHVSEKSQIILKSLGHVGGEVPAGRLGFPFTEDSIRSLADSLLSVVKNTAIVEVLDGSKERELKATILELQQELQEKDIQMNRICDELVSQIKEAESVAKRNSLDLDSAMAQVNALKSQVEVMGRDKESLELRINELKGLEASSEGLNEQIKSLTELLSAKDQEIEALMQALDEEESQMEVLESRKGELENTIQEKDMNLHNLEVSREKALAKLSTTVNKFDELHDLSESLLAEVENLQAQLQGRDSEISFLRQEVTRCTNDVLAAEEINKKYSSEVHELLQWMDMMASRFGVNPVHLDNENFSQIHVYTEILGKHILSMLAELDDIRLTAQSKDSLLQIERAKVEQLVQKVLASEASLREKEVQVELFQRGKDSSQLVNIDSPGHSEREQKRSTAASVVAPHVRAVRKVNGDQVAIAIDNEQDNNALNDEDDDKAHGFKALTMSRMFPRVARPIADRIDAIWVSGDRLLMRQPTMRFGVILYWIMLHALLASII
ncbi:Tropomyosin domain-containing protein [Dioscorea alata]|uniref:Tropomyosin domain-containing protein n=2 Tax=Dioscorea alata TaxID=55571 RepID=A0ACB7VKB4_DIOAL|nr:Tropomyosin domain-containing protein [Dioscorea alata]KAH7674716.1 Tropomyosin domain-containing protein [Dioscorea alata]